MFLGPGATSSQPALGRFGVNRPTEWDMSVEHSLRVRLTASGGARTG